MIAGDQMSGTQSLKWLSDQVKIGSGVRLSLIALMIHHSVGKSNVWTKAVTAIFLAIECLAERQKSQSVFSW